MRRILLLAALASPMAGPAAAKVASPYDSYVSPCLVTCPAGDSLVVVIVRNIIHEPEPGDVTTVNMCGCPDVRLQAPAPDAPYTLLDDCRASRNSDAIGYATFPLEAGGTCKGSQVVVDADGVIIATRSVVASFDQNGDWVVDGSDIAAVIDKIGTSDSTADFNCDGAVTTEDRDIAMEHLGHAAPALLAVGPAARVRLSARPVPNPARRQVDFVLNVPRAGRARLTIHDLSGRRIAVVLDRALEAGAHHAAWNGEDAGGRRVPPGLYFYGFQVDDRIVRGTIVVAR